MLQIRSVMHLQTQHLLSQGPPKELDTCRRHAVDIVPVQVTDSSLHPV